MKKVIALKSVRYNGVLRVPGTDSAEFEARPKDAKILAALRKVRILPSVEDKSLTAQDPGSPSPNKYMRRDVQPENLVNRDQGQNKSFAEVVAGKEVKREKPQQKAKTGAAPGSKTGE